jgi:hypothetical protein
MDQALVFTEYDLMTAHDDIVTGDASAFKLTMMLELT